MIIDVTGWRETTDERARFDIVIVRGGDKHDEVLRNMDWPTAWRRLTWAGVMGANNVERVLSEALEHGSHQVSV
jgi:hypothetical protein